MANTPISQKKFLGIFIGSWLVWAAVHVYVMYSLGVSVKYAIADSVISNVLLCGASVLLSNNLQYYLPKKDRYWYILTFSMFIAAAVWLLVKYIIKWAGIGDLSYQYIVQQSYTIRYCIAFLITAFMAVISVLWYTFDEKEKETQRVNETARLAREAELFKLRQQLQPHFLFNSLNSINALIGSKPAEARTMVQQLSSFLRSTLKKDDNQWVPLKEELEQLELYLSIEKVRFGNRLQTDITTDEETLELKLPVLLLQPLVENAIKFGLYGTVGETRIGIHAAVVDGQLVLAVINPFDSDGTPEEKGTGFGLNSVKRRLYLLYGRNDLVETEMDGNQFIVSVTIPQMV
ncbi:MAG TPA: histidine kinase [Ferruginibacter sp.]|nr:histidine kinase [Ferruginibacter sp.]